MTNKTRKYKVFEQWTFNKYRRHVAYLLLLISLIIKLYNCAIYGKCEVKNNSVSVVIGDVKYMKMILIYSFLTLFIFILNIYPFFLIKKK